VLRRALLAAVAAALFWPAAAHAGVFAQVGPTIVYTADQGAVDDIAAFPTPTTIRFTRFGGGAIGPGQNCVFVDDNAVDCPKAGITSVVLNLGDGDDVASVAQDLTIPFIFNGGPGRDGLFGGGGLDVFDGGSDDDSIVSRDTRLEQVDCGDGHDTAISDDADVRISCEEVEGDADGDGIRHPADCDDTNPAIHPGAVDIPGDGIDQDCSGLRRGDPRPRPRRHAAAAGLQRRGRLRAPRRGRADRQRRGRELRRAGRPVPAAHRQRADEVDRRGHAHAQRRAPGQALPNWYADHPPVHRLARLPARHQAHRGPGAPPGRPAPGARPPRCRAARGSRCRSRTRGASAGSCATAWAPPGCPTSGSSAARRTRPQGRASTLAFRRREP